MKFGVFIRSIGERTEKLCYDSVRRCVSPENIHILRHYYPSYKVYLKMFQVAKREGYDWYLGVDADVVLREDWLDVFKARMEEPDTYNNYKLTFRIRDYVSGQIIERGNNWYNGEYNGQLLSAFKRIIHIGRFWFYYKKRGASPGHITKPESSLSVMMKEKFGLLSGHLEEVIGWHAYEQYYAETFRQYMTRRKREPDFQQKHDLIFLDPDSRDKLMEAKDLDRYVANIAWNETDQWKLKKVDARIRKKIIPLIQDMGIQEKGDLQMTCEEFYGKYNIS